MPLETPLRARGPNRGSSLFFPTDNDSGTIAKNLGALGARYRTARAGTQGEVPPRCDPGHVYHLFPVRSAAREARRTHLTAHGIDTLIHDPCVPIPRQRALEAARPAACPTADRVCDEIVSVPLYPSLPAVAVDRVAEAIRGVGG